MEPSVPALGVYQNASLLEESSITALARCSSNALNTGDTSPNLRPSLSLQVHLIIQVFRGMSTSSKDLASLLQWYSTVEAYTSRYLTVASDKFVALPGLAKKSSESLQCEYLAGLWSKCIHVGLAWEVPTNAHAVRVPARAPSWS